MLLDLPSSRDEDWRWSDPASIDAARRIERSAGVIESMATFLSLEGPRLVFIDGCFDEDWSDPAGFELGSYEASSEHPLGRHASGQGYELRFEAGAATIVQILHTSTGGDNHLPLRIRVAAGAAVTIVETFTGAGWANRLTEIDLAPSARLMRSVRLLQDEGFISLRDEAVLAEGARLESIVLASGAMGSRIDASVRLAGAGASAEVGGALLARGQQRHDASYVVRHDEPSGTSRQLWRSVADDRATCSVAARVEVARDAQKTDGEQSLKGLLLSRTATVNAKPELEIFADDVKCAHGATVGELDRDALFYMASRGVPEAEAKALLTRAFVADALERIGEQAVREAFEADAEGWFR
ncbi:MAG: Fe-S cluster assembly protein SufD [Sphingomonadales bacterium]|nr:Fe-S cluster assembly protein SufD [Sphingomonadales bacterium]